MSKLEQFLESSTLPDEAKALIREAWEQEKKDLAAEMRQEFKTRYTEDLGRVVEGLENMTSTVITESLTDVHEERRKLVEDRVKLRNTVGKYAQFANAIISEEVSNMRTKQRKIEESLGKYATFTNNIIAEELQEFHTERNNLVEARVQLMAHGRQRIEEARRDFVKRASQQTAYHFEQLARREFTQLRESLQEARANMFGRKLFEAFQAEFRAVIFNEDVELRRVLQNVQLKNEELLESRKEIANLKGKLDETTHRIAMMEDAQVRRKTIDQLVNPLNPKQRSIMEGLLEKTPTTKLKEDFNKYFKAVINGSTQAQPKHSGRSNALVESNGNRVQANKTPVTESVVDSEFDMELNQILKNAGIQ